MVKTLQFVYKPNSSTIVCSTPVIETIQYFTSLNTSICAPFIESSKAFDRLYHSKLFSILSERDMCP